MSKKRTVVFSIVAVMILGAGAALAAGLLNLPMIGVYVTHCCWRNGISSTLDVTLDGVPDGYDVRNGTYPGWCLEDNFAPDPPDNSLLTLMDSTDPDSFGFPCENFENIPWDRVNYLLNHKSGEPWDQQLALWVVAETDYVGRTLTPEAEAMVADTALNGAGFLPSPGQRVAVAICADGLSGEVDPSGIQDTIIEVLLRRGGEGCTPGYWKQKHHFDSWPTEYKPGDDFGLDFGVFNVDDSWDDTLESALRRGGGGEKALLRHATAALLNATSPDVQYFYTVEEVFSMVEEAYADGAFENIKDQFEAANELGCPLD